MCPHCSRFSATGLEPPSPSFYCSYNLVDFFSLHLDVGWKQTSMVNGRNHIMCTSHLGCWVCSKISSTVRYIHSWSLPVCIRTTTIYNQETTHMPFRTMPNVYREAKKSLITDHTSPFSFVRLPTIWSSNIICLPISPTMPLSVQSLPFQVDMS